MTIGAMARMGMVWLPITQGIMLRSRTREWTTPMPMRMPAAVPIVMPAMAVWAV